MAKKFHTLIVDDEESITYLLKTELEEREQIAADVALNGTEAINLIQSHVYDVVLLDVKMPRVGGIEVLKYLKEHSPTTQAIMLTNIVDVKIAIETTKLGAYDFVSKPYDIDELLATVRRAIEHRQLLISNQTVQGNKKNELVGQSPVFTSALAHALKLSVSDAFVLIHGPSGTGKELFAQLIHHNSARKDLPFVALNCAAMPDQLLESELFGHEKGSFTSAVQTKQGLVEVANGGTLFLDEVGDISPATQPKLLRFLETGEFRRVGGTSTRTVDVRVISATNKNLEEEVKAGRFRDDLLYRLNVVSLRLPLLKERRDDIPLLAEYFLSRKSKTKRLSDEARAALSTYDWPGNVRELEHVVEGAVALCHSDIIQPSDLWMGGVQGSVLPSRAATSGNGELNLLKLVDVEREHILKVLKHNKWNRLKSAHMLGISPKTLYLKIKGFRLKPSAEDLSD